MVEALTAPVTFMLLGLPARTYLVILALLAANAFMLCTFSFQVLTSSIGMFLNAAVAACAAAVLVSCAVRSISGERSRRMLFLLHCSLSAQCQLLSDDASVRRYREVLLANRELYGIGTTAQGKGSEGRGGGGSQHLSRWGSRSVGAAAASALLPPSRPSPPPPPPPPPPPRRRLPPPMHRARQHVVLQHVARAVTVN